MEFGWVGNLLTGVQTSSIRPSEKIGRRDVCESLSLIVFSFPRNVGESFSLVAINNLIGEWIAEKISRKTLACSAGVFFERAICLRKRHVEIAPTVRVTISTPPNLIKDGDHSTITNTNKVSPTQNTPALQARKTSSFVDSLPHSFVYLSVFWLSEIGMWS